MTGTALLSPLPDEFHLPDGTQPGVQQPVHEPAGSPGPADPLGEHGPGHECFQHGRPSHGDEPAQGPGHGAVRAPRPADAPAAGLRRAPGAAGHEHAGYEEALPGGGERILIYSTFI